MAKESLWLETVPAGATGGSRAGLGAASVGPLLYASQKNLGQESWWGLRIGPSCILPQKNWGKIVGLGL